MIKKTTVIAILICFHSLLSAQVNTIDSLENLLKQRTRKDSVRINLLNKIAYELRRTDNEKGYKYALEADSLSEILSFRKGKAESLRMIGRYFRSKGDYTKALEFAENALQINEEIGYKKGIAFCLGDISAVHIYLNNYAKAADLAQKALAIAQDIGDNTQISLYLSNLGIIFQKTGDYPRAMDYYQAGLKIAEMINDIYSVNAYYGNIGVIYQAQGNYPYALEYYQKSLKLCESSNDKRGICYASANIGEVYLSQNEYPKAREYYLRSLSLAEEINDTYMILNCTSLIGEIYIKEADFSQALAYLQRALKTSKESRTQSITSQILKSIGTIYENQDKLTEALDNYQKALEISEKIGEKPTISQLYMHLGSVYLKQKNYRQAFVYTNKSLTIAEKLKLLSNKSEIMQQLSQIYGSTGDYKKAYQTFKTYKQLDDSIFNNEKLKKISELEISYKYEKEKQAAEFEQQKKDELGALQMRRQKVIAYSSGTVLLLVCFIAFLIYRSYRQQKMAYSVLKATQSQLIQSEKMASLGELTAGIAHEIQNPLNFVNNFSESSNQLMDEMMDEVVDGNKDNAIEIANDIKQNLIKINQHGKRADSIVKGMLQHSRVGIGHKEPTDINALADEFLRLTYHGFKAKNDAVNVKIETVFDENLSSGKGKISIVQQEIGRVIMNLLNNALYAVEEKRKLEPMGYEPVITVSTKKLADKVEIKITDNGTGIPQKITKKIFQPFITTKPAGKGTGLGLSISYDIIVHLHNGKISFKTEEGKFTEFTVILPINLN